MSTARVEAAGSLLERSVGSLMWRRLKDQAFKLLCALALALLLAPLIWLGYSVISKAVPHFSLSVLTHPGSGAAGGLLNAITGTALISFGVAVVAGLVGTLTGIYLSELGRRARGIARAGCELLAGVPSIVLGYVGYVLLVVGLKWGFSWLNAVIVLSLMVVPYVAKSTEVALQRIPLAYREAGFALGMNKWEVFRYALLRPALPGMLTGLVLALAISVGETAPLLYTAGWSNELPHLSATHAPTGYLTYVVFTDFNQPFKSAQVLSNDAALLLFAATVLLSATGFAMKTLWRAPGEERGLSRPKSRPR